jgi:ubiquinone/menaquinone biosynthesis C-methylase UbiE
MKTSRQFYTELTVEKLAERKKPELTKREIKYLKKILTKKQRILDLGCGYGRFTIPLAKQGYKIQGIDITPTLINKAIETAKKEKLKINFKIGDMRNLPYKNGRFDVIICMWSVLNEIIKKSDQLKTIKEMLRVLSTNGFALIEMPLPLKIKKQRKIIEYKEAGDKLIFEKNSLIVKGKIGGIKARLSYTHNKKTLTELMKKTKIKKFRIFIDKFGGRHRFFLKFYK